MAARGRQRVDEAARQAEGGLTSLAAAVAAWRELGGRYGARLRELAGEELAAAAEGGVAEGGEKERAALVELLQWRERKRASARPGSTADPPS